MELWSTQAQTLWYAMKVIASRTTTPVSHRHWNKFAQGELTHALCGADECTCTILFTMVTSCVQTRCWLLWLLWMFIYCKVLWLNSSDVCTPVHWPDTSVFSMDGNQKYWSMCNCKAWDVWLFVNWESKTFHQVSQTQKLHGLFKISRHMMVWLRSHISWDGFFKLSHVMRWFKISHVMRWFKLSHVMRWFKISHEMVCLRFCMSWEQRVL